MNISNQTSRALKPLKLRHALLLFGIPSLVFGLSIYVLMPFLYERGVPLFVNWLISVGCFALLLVAAMIGLRKDGYAWRDLKARFRLKPMNKKMWAWSIACFIVSLSTYLGLSFTMELLPEIPWLDDTVYLSMFVDTYAGFEYAGNYWIILLHLVFMCFNILGEELWWRGYIFPRQQLRHGKYTWLVHGTLWAFFHIFHFWDIIKLLPGCLFLSYAIQKTANTNVGIIYHTLFNSMALWVVILPKIIV
ncbi:MAG: CPBP family intramembrane glutamic endopeptidase [Flammeovirgaceae bacterium]